LIDDYLPADNRLLQTAGEQEIGQVKKPPFTMHRKIQLKRAHRALTDHPTINMEKKE
jgi:hypothetical protein